MSAHLPTHLLMSCHHLGQVGEMQGLERQGQPKESDGWMVGRVSRVPATGQQGWGTQGKLRGNSQEEQGTAPGPRRGRLSSQPCLIDVLSALSAHLPREETGPAAFTIIWAIKTGRWSCWTEHSSQRTDTMLEHWLTRSALVLVDDTAAQLGGEPWGTPSLFLQGCPGAGGAEGGRITLGEPGEDRPVATRWERNRGVPCSWWGGQITDH